MKSEEELNSPHTPVSTLNTFSDRTLTDGLGRGTQSYTAPEILERSEYSTPSDNYSMGVSFYVMLNGQEPFAACKNGVQMIVSVTKGFFECGMQVDPDKDGPKAGVTRYLDGEIVESKILQVIRDLVRRDPDQRPSASAVFAIVSE